MSFEEFIRTPVILNRYYQKTCKMMTIMRCGQFYKEAMKINMVIFVLDLMA